ncbi:MAG TPA: hypothetical protein VGJ00_01040, partial [Rhabdochlamydiaceae bacterium]
PVDNPEEVQLQGLIAWVEACNFNIFFKKLTQSINWDLIPLHERPNLDQLSNQTPGEYDKGYAQLMRTWMQKNPNALLPITVLDLRNSGLSMLPSEIGLLVNLTVLNLEHNQLQQLVPEIGNLGALQELYLEHNQLQQYPVEYR